jgi:hypothetical protein
MEPQTECEPTTKGPIQNTSQPQNEQQGSESSINKKPTKSEQSTDRDAARSSRNFTLLDLRRLTFTLDGEHVLNAQDATNEQFDALAQVVSDVSNVLEWYLEERRDFMNGLRVFCEERNYPFPFTMLDDETQPTTPHEAQAHEVSEQEGDAHKNAEEGPDDAL